jgi:hypothetical protein
MARVVSARAGDVQVVTQGKIGHSKIISGNAHVEKVNITAWLRVSARNRPEDGQLRNAVFPAQLGELQPHRPDLVQGHASCSLHPPGDVDQGRWETSLGFASSSGELSSSPRDGV